MPSQFQFSIPSPNSTPTNLTLNVGDVLYILGANGTGKSGLISYLYRVHLGRAKRISAHRQTWFESNTPDMTARSRNDVENTVRNHDAQARSRYWEWNGSQRASLVMFDLINAVAMQERKIVSLLRSGDDLAANAHNQARRAGRAYQDRHHRQAGLSSLSDG